MNPGFWMDVLFIIYCPPDRYSAEWEKTVRRMGRWIDFKDDYKTLDATFMESVWWVFAQLWQKGLVYRGFKVPRPDQGPGSFSDRLLLISAGAHRGCMHAFT